MAVAGSYNGNNYEAEACHLQDGDQKTISLVPAYEMELRVGMMQGIMANIQ